MRYIDIEINTNTEKKRIHEIKWSSGLNFIIVKHIIFFLNLHEYFHHNPGSIGKIEMERIPTSLIADNINGETFCAYFHHR